MHQSAHSKRKALVYGDGAMGTPFTIFKQGDSYQKVQKAIDAA